MVDYRTQIKQAIEDLEYTGYMSTEDYYVCWYDLTTLGYDVTPREMLQIMGLDNDDVIRIIDTVQWGDDVY